MGLELGADLGGGPFTVESDCKLAVQILGKEEESCTDLDSVVERLKIRKGETSCRGIQFVFRECNRLAHLLAKITLRNVIGP